MNIIKLSDQQMAVAEATGSKVLVLGGAGTGKTTAALWAAHDALMRGEVSPYQKVLFLTFSRSAVSQIATRARGLIDLVRDSIEISTFHAFSLRILRSFGRYAGLGLSVPRIQSAACNRLIGHDITSISYDQLITEAIRVMGTVSVGTLVADRWPVVICDEFQDTGSDHSRLLDQISTHSKLILLADANQMIYTFVPGVGPRRLQDAHNEAQKVIELQAASFRDPTGCIPAMAEAIRERQFSAREVRHAVDTGRLTVHKGVTNDSEVEVLKSELRIATKHEYGSVQIFVNTNEGVAQLGDTLTDCGIEHSIVGHSEAQGEALAALSVLTQYGSGLIEDDRVELALAIYLTACTRGRQPPSLAQDLAFEQSRIPDPLQTQLKSLKCNLIEAAHVGFESLITTACGTWDQLGEQLGLSNGNRPWHLATLRFAASAHRIALSRDPLRNSVQKLAMQVERDRISVLADSNFLDHHSVQIMNFHQAKGREADQVILLYRSDDYLADHRDVEPFTKSSRVLYVALTRARHRVVVLLPERPHRFIAPFASIV